MKVEAAVQEDVGALMESEAEEEEKLVQRSVQSFVRERREKGGGGRNESSRS